MEEMRWNTKKLPVAKWCVGHWKWRYGLRHWGSGWGILEPGLSWMMFSFLALCGDGRILRGCTVILVNNTLPSLHTLLTFPGHAAQEVNLVLSSFFFFLFFPSFFVCVCVCVCVCFLGSHPQHMEVPRLGVKSELQPLACTTVTATWDLSHVLRPRPQLLATPDP